MAQTLALSHSRSKTRKELYTLSKLQLIKKCKASNVSINGNKSEMIDRLLGNNSNNYSHTQHKHTVTTEPLSPPSKDTRKPLSLRSSKRKSSNNRKQRKRDIRPLKLRLNPRRSENPHSSSYNANKKKAPKLGKRYKSHSPHRADRHVKMNRPKPKKDTKQRSKSKKPSKKKKHKGRNRFSSRAQVPPGDMVLVIGSHAFREFGMAQDKTLITLTQLTPLIPSDAKKNITRIYSGYYYSYYTDNKLHNIWSAGYNLHGELACGKTGNLILPLTKVDYFRSHEPEILLNKLCVNVASWTVFWITENYKLYGNGMNDDYQLGLGGRYDTDHIFEPVLVKQLYDLPIIDVQCAHKYSIALSAYNEDIIARIITHWIKECESVKLIYNDYDDNHQTAFSFSSLSSSSGFHFCQYQSSHFNVIFSEEIMSILMLYCDKRQSVWSTGFNEYGGGGVAKCQLQELQELKLQDSASAVETKWRELTVLNDREILSISTGYEHTLFLTADGKLLSCGDNEFGQLGLSMEVINEQNILHSLSKHRSVERECIHIPMEITTFTVKVKEIKCGMYHSICIDENYSVYSWGHGKFGQCGHKEFKDRGYFKPKLIEWFVNLGHKIDKIDCGNYHSYCRGTNGLHFIFGSNKYNQCLDKKRKNLNLPWCFNKLVSKKWKYKDIKDVFLGFDNTKIILCDKD